MLLQGDHCRLLGTLLEFFGRASLSLGTLWDTLWSFGSHLTLRRDTFQSVGFSTVGHSQGATRFLWGGPWHPLGLPLGSLERSCSSLGHIQHSPGAPSVQSSLVLTHFAFGPASVLQGRGHDV